MATRKTTRKTDPIKAKAAALAAAAREGRPKDQPASRYTDLIISEPESFKDKSGRVKFGARLYWPGDFIRSRGEWNYPEQLDGKSEILPEPYKSRLREIAAICRAAQEQV